MTKVFHYSEVVELQFTVAQQPLRKSIQESLCISRLGSKNGKPPTLTLSKCNGRSKSVGISAGISKGFDQNDIGRAY